MCEFSTTTPPRSNSSWRVGSIPPCLVTDAPTEPLLRSPARRTNERRRLTPSFNKDALTVASWTPATTQPVSTGKRSTQVIVSKSATTTNQPTRNIPAEYLTAHAHLAYAATAHGLQGATEHHGYADTGVALYVPMTRGEKHNTAIIIARDRKTAIASLTDQILQSQEEITPKQLAANLHRELMKVGERVTTTDTTLAESATDTNAVAATNALRAAQITALTPTERERADQHFTHHHTEWHHHITTDTDTATNPTTDNPATDAMDGKKRAVRNYQADIITGRRLLAEQVRRVRVINPDPDDTPQPDITTDTPSISL